MTLQWEAVFVRSLGLDLTTGLAVDSAKIDSVSGLPILESDKFSNGEAEGLNLALIAKVLDGNKEAQVFFSEDEALSLLKTKIDTYENFDSQFPGFLGYLPTLLIDEKG